MTKAANGPLLRYRRQVVARHKVHRNNSICEPEIYVTRGTVVMQSRFSVTRRRMLLLAACFQLVLRSARAKDSPAIDVEALDRLSRPEAMQSMLDSYKDTINACKNQIVSHA